MCRSWLSVHLEAHLHGSIDEVLQVGNVHPNKTLVQNGERQLDSTLSFIVILGSRCFLCCSAPESNLELQWAFGFNSTAGRGVVHYTAKGNLVVGAGSAGVVTHQVWLFSANLNGLHCACKPKK